MRGECAETHVREILLHAAVVTSNCTISYRVVYHVGIQILLENAFGIGIFENAIGELSQNDQRLGASGMEEERFVILNWLFSRCQACTCFLLLVIEKLAVLRLHQFHFGCASLCHLMSELLCRHKIAIGINLRDKVVEPFVIEQHTICRSIPMVVTIAVSIYRYFGAVTLLDNSWSWVNLNSPCGNADKQRCEY